MATRQGQTSTQTDLTSSWFRGQSQNLGHVCMKSVAAQELKWWTIARILSAQLVITCYHKTESTLWSNWKITYAIIALLASDSPFHVVDCGCPTLCNWSPVKTGETGGGPQLQNMFGFWPLLRNGHSRIFAVYKLTLDCRNSKLRWRATAGRVKGSNPLTYLNMAS